VFVRRLPYFNVQTTVTVRELLDLSRIVAVSRLNPICSNCNSKRLPVLLQAARASWAHLLIKFHFTPAFPTGLLINENLKGKENEKRRRGRKFARWTNEKIQNYRVELYMESVFNVWRHFKKRNTPFTTGTRVAHNQLTKSTVALRHHQKLRRFYFQHNSGIQVVEIDKSV
jgi:hypothetical protein